MEEVDRLVEIYNDDGLGKTELVNCLKSLARKEKNDMSFGILVRHFLDRVGL